MVINGSGYKLVAEIENLIVDYIDGKSEEIPFAKREDIGRTIDYAIGRHRYIASLISVATRSFKGVRVGLDLANGAATTVAKGVFDALGAKTYVINAEPDGTNINRGCGSTHIEKLQEFVVDTGLDVGFAYDGDADRCLAVDDKGRLIDGDIIMYLCACYMKQRGELNNNTGVATVMSNLGLFNALDKAGIGYEKTAVGDKYVFENMMLNNHSLGGENSGLIIFSKHATTGDGVLTSLKLMEVMLENKAPLSKLAEPITILPQVLKNVRVSSKQGAREDEDVIKAVKQVETELGNSGRILLRESGTEPVIRVMVEAADLDTCHEKVDAVIQVIKEKGWVSQ